MDCVDVRSRSKISDQVQLLVVADQRRTWSRLVAGCQDAVSEGATEGHSHGVPKAASVRLGKDSVASIPPVVSDT